MDLTGIDAAVKSVDTQTIPEARAAGSALIFELIEGLHGLLDRIRVNFTFSIEPRGANVSDTSK